MGALLSRYLWKPTAPISIDPSDLKDTFEVDWSEDNAIAIQSLIDAELPAPVIAVLDDDQFRSFDPLADRAILAAGAYSSSFGELVEAAVSIVDSFVTPIVGRS